MRLGLGLWFAAALGAQNLEVRAHTLANGMRVLIHEDHDIPNVALYLFFKVGARNERPGTTGLSHFFEHMMFNGAKKYGPKQFDIQMEKNGGRNNGYTTSDVTVYTDFFPRTALDLMFDMEADRIRDLAFDPKIIESERGVVHSERRLSVDNNNMGALHEQVNAVAFTAHPYGNSVVGWPSDIEGWSLEDLKSHFRMGYAPNNCVLVVAGAVSEAEILALAKKYLEPIPRQEPPPPVRTREPEQRGERRLTIEKPAELPLLMVGYHVPEAAHADTPAIAVMNALLTQGRSSRLQSRLIERDQLALTVTGRSQPGFDPGLMVIIAQPRAGVDPARTEAALHEETGRLGAAEPGEDELRRARNQLIAAHYRGLKTIAGKANTIGGYEVFSGGYQKLAAYEAEIAAVTPAEIRRVAGKYLARRNRTVGTLLPEKKEAAR
ncbi:MAG: insulinase family protein [Acidobacteria bacterium]|nr:insulinase family protein [Acidobacteriota bacterium]